MEKFTVPQFIENEDKILWFLNVRQFLIILISFGLIFLLYKLASTAMFVVGAILIGGGAGVVAFLEVNGQPFHFFLLNIAKTTQRPALRVWKKEATKKEWEAEERAMVAKLAREEQERLNSLRPDKQALTPQRLSELSLIVDTGGAYQGDTY
ncbi:MAG: PrgI family protein, partial [bacterium]|nr:PrgI family protein [bacterium]